MIFLKIIKYAAILMIALLLCGAMYQYIITTLDKRKYRPIGKLIDVGGYKLHMIDSSYAKASADTSVCKEKFQTSKNYDAMQPAVVLDSGIGSTIFDWSLVYPEIAKFARVIAYDRAGYGWSDASPLPRISANIVAELHTILHNAGVQGPYLLVGHSFGGMNVRLFAATYPDEVAGIVLVDAVHESVMDRLPQIFIEFRNWIYRRLVASYIGIPRIISDYKSYVYPAEAKNKAVDRLHKTTIEYFRTLFNQLNLIPVSCEQMKAAQPLLPNVPVTVITEGKQIISQQGPCGSYTTDEVIKINATWLQLQADLVTPFPQGKQVIAEQSGHNIPYDQPQIIVDAVREMMTSLLG